MTTEPPVRSAEPERRPHRLAFLGTSSRAKHLLLGAGAILLAVGTWQNGIEPDGFTRAGAGILLGYVIGRVVRHFVRFALLGAAVLATVAAVVAFSGIVPAAEVDAWANDARDWLTGAGQSLRTLLLQVAPAGVLTTVALVAGFSRG